MEDRKKPKGTKARVQAYKKRLMYIGHATIVAVLVGIIIVSGFFLYSMLYPSSEQNPVNPTFQFKPENPDSKSKAAIVDHLSLTFPNQTFVNVATEILTDAEFQVDYYDHEKVTTDFYKNLPSKNYRLIVLRVHSGIAPNNATVFMFTSEPYSKTKYLREQLNDEVYAVTYDIHAEEKPLYFAILPRFITNSVKGQFNNTAIILMGCRGLQTETMANVFIQRGAKAYISWNNSVSASHTDQATTNLLHHLVLEKQTIKKAVEDTMKEVGPDPTHNSLLTYYPLEIGEQTIENITDGN